MTNPNIILIVADDQPKGLTDAMPFVSSYIKEAGLFLSNAISQTSICSPARASILTGKYSNKTTVWTNEYDPDGPWTCFNQSGAENLTLATKLKNRGYRTSLIGKYINHFSDAGQNYVPPGWDDFITMFTGDGPYDGGAGSYYNYHLAGTIYPEFHGTDPEDYSTDVLRDKAVNIINNTPETTPLFLYFTPWGPHGNFTPAPRHEGLWQSGDATLPGSFNEADMSDKPAWMQSVAEADFANETQNLKDMHETVMSIDEAVQAIVTAMGSRMDNTYIIYTSDNGKMLGSHRITKKDLPHRWSSEVPLFVRGPGIAPATDSRITPNVDVTATIAEVCGLNNWAMDGKSVLTTGRTGVPVAQRDNWKDQKHPGYIGWRTPRFLYVEYTANQGREFYDYQNDPDELNNLINSTDPYYVDKIAELRDKARNATPWPPGFTLN